MSGDHCSDCGWAMKDHVEKVAKRPVWSFNVDSVITTFEACSGRLYMSDPQCSSFDGVAQVERELSVWISDDSYLCSAAIFIYTIVNFNRKFRTGDSLPCAGSPDEIRGLRY